VNVAKDADHPRALKTTVRLETWLVESDVENLTVEIENAL